MNTSPAPPCAREPRCTRWKSPTTPSTALYMSIGRHHDPIGQFRALDSGRATNIGATARALPVARRLYQRSMRLSQLRSRSLKFSWLTRWLRVKSE